MGQIRQCLGRTKQGKPCANPPLTGGHLCYDHAVQAQRAQLAKSLPSNVTTTGTAVLVPPELVGKVVYVYDPALWERLRLRTPDADEQQHFERAILTATAPEGYPYLAPAYAALDPLISQMATVPLAGAGAEACVPTLAVDARGRCYIHPALLHRDWRPDPETDPELYHGWTLMSMQTGEDNPFYQTPERLGVSLTHELIHLLYEHHNRGDLLQRDGSFQRRLWELATDAENNDTLLQNPHTMELDHEESFFLVAPESETVPFPRGETAETYYRKLLELQQQLQGPSSQQSQGQGSQQGQDGQQGQGQGGQQSQDGQQDQGGQRQGQDGQQGQSQGSQQSQGNQQSQDGQQQGQGGQQSQGQGSQQGQDGQQSQGGQQGQSQDGQQSQGGQQGQGQGSQQGQDGQQQGQGGQQSQDGQQGQSSQQGQGGQPGSGQDDQGSGGQGGPGQSGQSSSTGVSSQPNQGPSGQQSQLGQIDPNATAHPCAGGSAAQPVQAVWELPISDSEQNGVGEHAGHDSLDMERIRQATAQAVKNYVKQNPNHGIGGALGGMARWADKKLAPPAVDWKALLRRQVYSAFTEVINGQQDYRVGPRPTNIEIANHLPARLPSMIAHKPRTAIVVDTSGSMGDLNGQGHPLWQAVGEVDGFVQALSRQAGVNEPVPLYCTDADVYERQQVRRGKVGAVNFVGGGGTDMNPGVITAAMGESPRKRPDIIVLITDGYVPRWPTAEELHKQLPRGARMPRIVLCLVNEEGDTSQVTPGWEKMVAGTRGRVVCVNAKDPGKSQLIDPKQLAHADADSD